MHIFYKEHKMDSVQDLLKHPSWLSVFPQNKYCNIFKLNHSFLSQITGKKIRIYFSTTLTIFLILEMFKWGNWEGFLNFWSNQEFWHAQFQALKRTTLLKHFERFRLQRLHQTRDVWTLSTWRQKPSKGEKEEHTVKSCELERI